MSVMLIPVLLVLFAIFAVVLATIRFQQERIKHVTSLEGSPRILVYTVPEGQDPAVVMAELRRAEFDVGLTEHGATAEVMIGPARPGAPFEREQVRSVLEAVQSTGPDVGGEAGSARVRFADEAMGPRN